MRKYIGTSPISQKTKKISRSSAMNTPSMPVSRKRNSIMYALTLSLMLNEASKASGVSSVVSNTMLSERPSTPKWGDEPIASYQVYNSWNWKPGCVARKLNHTIRDKARGTRLAPRANQRKSLFSPLGRNNMITAARAGTNRISERRCSVMKFIMDSLSQHEVIERRANDNENQQCEHEILLDTSSLDAAQFVAKPVGNIR